MSDRFDFSYLTWYSVYREDTKRYVSDIHEIHGVEYCKSPRDAVRCYCPTLAREVMEDAIALEDGGEFSVVVIQSNFWVERYDGEKEPSDEKESAP